MSPPPVCTELQLDAFIRDAYAYWRGGGATAIAIEQASRVLLAACLSAVLPAALSLIDINRLTACATDAHACGQLSALFTTAHLSHPRAVDWAALALALAHGAHVAVLLWRALGAIRAAVRTRAVYRALLGVRSSSALLALPWDAVVGRLQSAVAQLHDGNRRAVDARSWAALTTLAQLHAAHERRVAQAARRGKAAARRGGGGGAAVLASFAPDAGAVAGAAGAVAGAAAHTSRPRLQTPPCAGAGAVEPPASDPRAPPPPPPPPVVSPRCGSAAVGPSGPSSSSSSSSSSGGNDGQAGGMGGGDARLRVQRPAISSSSSSSSEGGGGATEAAVDCDEATALLAASAQPQPGAALRAHGGPPPLSGDALAARVSRQDDYLTALLREGGAQLASPCLDVSAAACGGRSPCAPACARVRLLRYACCCRRARYAPVASDGTDDGAGDGDAALPLLLWLPYTASYEEALRALLLAPLLTDGGRLNARFSRPDHHHHAAPGGSSGGGGGGWAPGRAPPPPPPTYHAAARELRARLLLAGACALLAAPAELLRQLVVQLAAGAHELQPPQALQPQAQAQLGKGAGATSGGLGARVWSPFARAALRGRAELPHAWARRMHGGGAAAAAASRYLGQFSSHPTAQALARTVATLAGAALALLLAAALWDDDLLLHVKVGEHTLLFVSAAAGAVLAAARALGGPDDPERWHGAQDPAGAMRELRATARHAPCQWARHPAAPATRAHVASLFATRAALLAGEALAPLTTPLLLLAVLPWRAEAILARLRSTTVQLNGLGAVCEWPPAEPLGGAVVAPPPPRLLQPLQQRRDCTGSGSPRRGAGRPPLA